MIINFLRNVYRFCRKNFIQNIIPKSKAGIFANDKSGIEVVGFFNSYSGIGESARLCAQNLSANGYKVKCTSVEKYFKKKGQFHWQFQDTAQDSEIGCRIIHLNPPMLPPYIFSIGIFKFGKIFNIGYWAWELEKIPKEWIKASKYMNAIFSPSDFTSKAIEANTNTSVTTVPHPVVTPVFNTGLRSKLGIPEDNFLVSTVFSFGSGVDRKNPAATVTAFNKAFSADSATLVIKTNNGQNSIEKKLLEKEIGSSTNILLIDEQWEAEDIAGLIQESDLYISLHRSEGFGLTILEAMLLKTPVIATGWSGNMQFCNSENTYLAQYELIQVKSNNPEFSDMKGARWADANIDDVILLLKKAFNTKNKSSEQIRLQTMNESSLQNSYKHALQRLNIISK